MSAVDAVLGALVVAGAWLLLRFIGAWIEGWR